MKTSITSRKILSISTVLAGALLLLSPSISAAFASNNFTYTNPGEQAFLNVTNNAGGATFTINGAFYDNGTGISLFQVNGTYANGTNFKLGSFNGNASYFNGLGSNGSETTFYTGTPENFSGYYLTSSQLAGVLANLQSVYLITGAGAGDHATVTNGLTSDIYSLVLPGSGGNVTVFTGFGSSTYAIQVGTGSSVTISLNTGIVSGGFDSNTTSFAGANNIFNIVYGNPGGSLNGTV